MMRSLNVIRFDLVLLVLFVASLGSFAGNRPQQQQDSLVAGHLPSMPAQDFVQRTINNELNAGNSDSQHYMYRDRRQTPTGSRTKMMVETKQGTVAYLIAVDDKPLTPEQRSQENQRIQSLLSSPDLQTRRMKAQQADNDRITRMFRQLPHAFLYQYQRVVPGSNGHEWVELSFRPDPNYDPPSRETSVFKAMNGTMVIDEQSERLVKIQAQLFKDVNFGWGILGHLNKGGQFIVEQSEVATDHWEPTYMNIQFSGKALLLKTIDLRQIETTGNYVRVPDNLTLTQGIDMLKRHAASTLAKNDPSGR